LVEVTGAGSASPVLECGPGTGVATVALADRFGHVTGVELGGRLAEVARRNLTHRADVEIVHASFDTWTPPTWGAFDLVTAATSWHWLDPDTRYRRVHRHLRPGGHLAFWTAMHVIPVDGDTFFTDIQDVYDRIGEGLPDGWTPTRPGAMPDDDTDDIERSGLFEVSSVDQYDWEVTYDADGYIGLLDTFSGHIAMEPWQREELYGAIRSRLGRRADGLLRRHYGAVLHIARRCDQR
jgi:SAM-dependent methyltransferase